MPTQNIINKVIKNYSVQGLYVILKTEQGARHVWLQPRESITVPEAQISEQVKTLHKRRLVNISN